MQVDYSIYRHLLSLHSDYFSSAARQTSVMLRAPLPPPTPSSYEGPKMFPNLVFYVYLSDVRKGGM